MHSTCCCQTHNCIALVFIWKVNISQHFRKKMTYMYKTLTVLHLYFNSLIKYIGPLACGEIKPWVQLIIHPQPSPKSVLPLCKAKKKEKENLLVFPPSHWKRLQHFHFHTFYPKKDFIDIIPYPAENLTRVFECGQTYSTVSCLDHILLKSEIADRVWNSLRTPALCM